MSHIQGSQDRDLHDENGEHIGTARTARGRDVERHEKRIRAHLEAHRTADVEHVCGACGHRVVLDGQGWWIDPDEIGNAPDLCLMNEPEPDQFGPHQVTEEN